MFGQHRGAGFFSSFPAPTPVGGGSDGDGLNRVDALHALGLGNAGLDGWSARMAALAPSSTSSYRPMHTSSGQRGRGGRGGRGGGLGYGTALFTTAPTTGMGQQSQDASLQPPPPPPSVVVVGTTAAAVRAWPVLYAAGFSITAVVATSAPPPPHARSDEDGHRQHPPTETAAATRRVEAFINGCLELYQLPLPPRGEAKPAVTGAAAAAAAAAAPPVSSPIPTPSPSPVGGAESADAKPGAERCGVVAVPSVTALFRSRGKEGEPPHAATKPSLATGTSTLPPLAETQPTAPPDATEGEEDGFGHVLDAADFIFIATGEDFAFTPPPPPPPLPRETESSVASTAGTGYAVERFLPRYGSSSPLAARHGAPVPSAPDGEAKAAKPRGALRNREGFLAACVERKKHLVFADGVPAQDTAALTRALESCLAPAAPTTTTTTMNSVRGNAGGERMTASIFVVDVSCPVPAATPRMKALVRALGLPPAPSPPTDATPAPAASSGITTAPPPPSSAAASVATSGTFTVSHAGFLAPRAPSLLPSGTLVPPSAAAAAADRTAPSDDGRKEGEKPVGAPRQSRGAIGRVKRIDMCLCDPLLAPDALQQQQTTGGDGIDGSGVSLPASFSFEQSVDSTVQRTDTAMWSLVKRALAFVDVLMGGRVPAAVQCHPLTFAAPVGSSDPDDAQEKDATGQAGTGRHKNKEEGEGEDYVYPDDSDDGAGDGTRKDAAPRARKVMSTPTSLEAELYFDIQYPAAAIGKDEGATPLVEASLSSSASSPVPVPPPGLPTSTGLIAAPVPIGGGGALSSASSIPPPLPPPLPSPPEAATRGTDGFVAETLPVKLYLSVEPSDTPCLLQELTISGTDGTIEMHDGILDCCAAGDDDDVATADADPVDDAGVVSRDVSRAASRCVVVTYGNGTSSTGARTRVRQEKVLFRFAPSPTEEGDATIDSSEKLTRQAALRIVEKDEAALRELACWQSMRTNSQYSATAEALGSSTSSPYASSRYARGGRYRSSRYAGEGERGRPDAAHSENARQSRHQRFAVKDSAVVAAIMRRTVAVQLVQDKLQEAAGLA